MSEDQKMIRDMAREFASDKIAPFAMSWDQNHEFPMETIRQMAELGLLGMTVSEEFEGAGLDTVSYALAVMEIAKGCSSVAVTMCVNHLVCSILQDYGSQQQKDRYLKDLASGREIGSFCLTEPQAGSDAQNQKTRATRTATGWVLQGKKAWITNGTYASVFVVTAVTSEDASGKKEISAFLVPRNAKGLILGKPEHKMGQCASNTIEVTLEGVELSEDAIIGGENGFKVMMNGLNSGRVGIASLCCGIAASAIREAVNYANERVAFGAPIANLQAIQFKIADMVTGLEASELLTLKAAWLKDSGKSYVESASMAKVFASEMVNRVTAEAVQIHGGNGYVREYLVEKLYRDARITTIYEGTSEIQRLVIGRGVLKKGFL